MNFFVVNNVGETGVEFLQRIAYGSAVAKLNEWNVGRIRITGYLMFRETIGSICLRDYGKRVLIVRALWFIMR